MLSIGFESYNFKYSFILVRVNHEKTCNFSLVHSPGLVVVGSNADTIYCMDIFHIYLS